jgi:RNA polymerase sigma-70 factor, ECF subfamily
MDVSKGHDEYERLVRPMEERMMHVVWGVTRNAEDAEEALQTALGVLWKKWDRVRVHPNPEALILRICSNSAFDVLRRRIRHEKRDSRAYTNELAAPKTPADILGAKECFSAIRQAIAQLSRNQAVAVTMRLVHGLSYGDIGRALGCRENTVRKHVERGREQLRGLLKRFVNDETGMERTR